MLILDYLRVAAFTSERVGYGSRNFQTSLLVISVRAVVDCGREGQACPMGVLMGSVMSMNF